MLNRLKTKEFWESASERALWTVGQVFIAGTASAALISEVNWKEVISACILAGLVSLVKSIVVGIPEVE